MSTGPTGPIGPRPFVRATGTSPNLPTGYTGPAPVISMEELLAVHNTPSKEQQDTARFQTMFTIDAAHLRQSLLRWAAAGYQPNYMVWSSPSSGVVQCLDGKTRSGMGYLEYCMNMSRAEMLAQLQTMLPGLNVVLQLSRGVISVTVTRGTTGFQ
jgi:hypothetical protein